MARVVPPDLKPPSVCFCWEVVVELMQLPLLVGVEQPTLMEFHQLHLAQKVCLTSLLLMNQVVIIISSLVAKVILISQR